MIKAFLSSLEDPERPLLGPNYWIMRKTGFILPKNIVAKTFSIITHEIVTLFVITQYMELYYIGSNLDLVLTNLKISMLSAMCIIKANSFVFYQESWKRVFRYVTEADKFERSHSDASTEAIVDKYTRYCRRLTCFYSALVFLTFLTTVIQPLMVYLTSSALRDAYRNGTEGFPHIFSSWVPFEKNHSPGCWLTVGWHTLLCFYGGCSMAAYDASVVVIMVFFRGKLDLLRERCARMLGRGGAGVSDQQADSAVRELQQIHVQLIIHSRLFNSLLSPVMFLYMVMCSLMLCASAFQLTSATNAAQKLILAEYLTFGIAQLFVFCWHSNDVLDKSTRVALGPYESEWWAAPQHQRRAMHLLAGQLTIKNIFSAGPFADLTLSTFITILKGAYSYYTLLNK